MANIIHNGKKYAIPDGATADETKDSLVAAGISELANATLEKKGDDYIANVKVGKKA